MFVFLRTEKIGHEKREDAQGIIATLHDKSEENEMPRLCQCCNRALIECMRTFSVFSI
jgi:hypothetical protein